MTASFPVTTPSCLSWRTRLAPLWLRRCPRKALRCFALPEAVNLNRFCIPLCVFCLGMSAVRIYSEFSDCFNFLSGDCTIQIAGPHRPVIREAWHYSGMARDVSSEIAEKCGPAGQNQENLAGLEEFRPLI